MPKPDSRVSFHHWLMAPAYPALNSRTALWFGLSLAIALLYALLALKMGLSGDRIVQDDARQYLFWMQRFQDPALFPEDLIADYFQSVTPLGYVWVYRAGMALGLDPFTVNKLLPLGLGLITTGYFFWLVMAIIPIPLTAGLASLLLNQTLWMKDDLVSATPRSFLYPLFIAFLYYLTRYRQQSVSTASPRQKDRRWLSLGLGAGAIALLGLFYPQYVLVVAMLMLTYLGVWKQGRLRLIGQRDTALMVSVYLAIATVVVAFYGLSSSDFGPVVTVEQARTMPEFWPVGRNFFFSENLWWFYGVGDRSGYLHVGLVRPAALSLGVFLPLLLWRWPRNPILTRLTPQAWLLARLLAAATVLFGLAHLLLFRLHLPSRYTDHSLRIIMAIAAAITLTVLLDALLRWGTAASPLRPILALGSAALLSGLVLIYPALVEDFPLTKYKQGTAIALYDWLQQQPRDIQVASVAEEVNNIPVFAQRSILVGREYAIPYHLGYYTEFRQRAIALIQAQYSPDSEDVTAFIERYGIDYWIVDRKAYDDDYLGDNWTRQYLSPDTGLTDLDPAHTDVPAALKAAIAPCTVLENNPLQVLDAQCVAQQMKN